MAMHPKVRNVSTKFDGSPSNSGRFWTEVVHGPSLELLTWLEMPKIGWSQLLKCQDLVDLWL